MVSELRATCACTAPIMLRAGAVVCSTCGAPIESVSDLPSVYASTGPLPRGWSRRRFLERVRTMTGARRAGGARGRGVVWEIDRVDFDRARAVLRSPVDRTRTVAAAAPTPGVDTWMRASGYRATRAS